MTKRNGLRIVFTLAIGALLASQALAVTTCGREALAGKYGFQIAGTAGDKADRVVGYGWLNFDGMGGVSAGYSAVSIAGAKAVEAKELSGTYTVAADCTFTVKVTDAADVTSNYAGAILGRGSDMFFTQTDEGSALSGSMQKMRRMCNNDVLVGPLGFRVTAGDGATQAVGTVVPRGTALDVIQWSTAKGKTIKFTGGTGKYSIAADCTVSITLDAIEKGKDKVEAATFKGVLSNNGREIVSMNTAKGTVGSFTAQ
jgi:hypothetical protein